MIKIYNTLTRKKEEFKPINDNEIGFYLCGPTVYDSAHLGHGRSAVAFDIIRRYLIYSGYKVNFVSNYTDVDDKMINRAKEKSMTVNDLTEEVIPLYERDYGALRVLPADKQPRATNYIKEIIAIIQKLEGKGAIYELDDGIYFDIKKFPEYGKLSRQKLEDLQMGARVEVNKKKKNPQDFALWKKEKPGEPSWDSPWGKGRPGWHIECSAMSTTLLGETLDIHAGGADLTFPHHECEIAQSETATGKPFVNYWMHNGFININEEKMSKSLGNFITLENLIEQYSGVIIRYLYLQTHYRSPINFTESLLEQSKQSLQRIHDFVSMVKRIKEPGQLHNDVKDAVNESQEQFENAMDDDFETPNALASLFEFIRKINTMNTNFNESDREVILSYLDKVDRVFKVIIPEETKLSEELMIIINERENARKNKDWDKSDELRDELLDRGIIVEDTAEGTIWKKTD